MDGWMDGWMDEWMDGWMDGWTDGWMSNWFGASQPRRTYALIDGSFVPHIGSWEPWPPDIKSS